MNFRFHLLVGAALLCSITGALAEAPATNTPPGPVEPESSAAVQPETPAPPQENAKSAPGAQSPNGTNGTTVSLKPVTKAPNTKTKKGDASATATESAPTQSATVPPAGAMPAAQNIPPSPARQKTFTLLDNYLQDLAKQLQFSADEKKEIQGYYVNDAVHLEDILGNNSASPMQQAKEVSTLRDERDNKIEALLGDAERQREFFKVEANYRVALTEAAADGTLCPAQQPAPAPAPAPSSTGPGQTAPDPTSKTSAP